MSLTIYHLHFSQADRIIWLCEELTALIPTFNYQLNVFPRGLESSEGKQALLSLHPSGTSPTILDTTVSPPVTLTESQAILEYIIHVHGAGHFSITPSAGAANYARYLYWLSFANGSFQAYLSANLQAQMILSTFNIPPAEAEEKCFVLKHFLQRTTNHLQQYESQLSRHPYLAGDDFSAADIMNIYGLTTMRAIYPIDISGYPNLLTYLKRVTDRPAYRKMLERAEEGMPPLIKGKLPRLSMEVMMSMRPWSDVMDGEGNALDGHGEGEVDIQGELEKLQKS